MKDYKIWVRTPIKSKSGSVIKAGLYAVIEDNEQYDRIPDSCTLENGEEIEGFTSFRFWSSNDTKVIPVYDQTTMYDIADLAKNYSKAEMLDDLEGLRPSFLTVAQFVTGGVAHVDGDDVETDGFSSVKEAWLNARLTDMSYKFITKKRSDQIFLNALKNL